MRRYSASLFLLPSLWLPAPGFAGAAPGLEEVRIEDGGFRLSESGRRFVPWGFNYDHDEAGRLLEDYWEAEWPKVAEDFREMKELGANTVRIHLQLARFLESPDRPNRVALDRLDRLLALAEETRLYLDLTGLGCYRKSDVPAWYDALPETGRWESQAAFWAAVAERSARSPAVFCYDLMNEPVSPAGRRGPGDWLGPPFAGKYHYVQMISLDQSGRPRPEIAREWIRKLTGAIRKHDRRHLITVGLVDWSLDRPGLTSGFVPAAIAPELDFLCIHLYPKAAKVGEALDVLRGFAAAGKPVVIEETFPLSAGPDDFRRFLVESRGTASGWIGFYWGQTPEECRRSDDFGAKLTLAWLEIFQAERDAMGAGSRETTALPLPGGPVARDDWLTSTPERQGIDSEKLAGALDRARERSLDIHSLLIARNGHLVLEAYFHPYDGTTVHDLASVTKSITTSLVGIAIDEGRIRSAKEPLLSLYPDVEPAHRGPRKERVLLEHLLSMSSGLDCTPEEAEITLRQMRKSADWVRFMLDLPMTAEPGERFSYCSGGMHLLSGIISRATGMSALEYARAKLFEPLGIREAPWPSDPRGVTHGWGDLHLHPRDMAKIGCLWLEGGVWRGRRIVSRDWVESSTKGRVAAGGDVDYGYGWWVFKGKRAGLYEANGRGGQRISVLPEKRVVVVFTGGGFEPAEIGEPLLAAIVSDGELPENPAGTARLGASIAAARKPPPPRPVPPLPEEARALSGKTFELEPNDLGLKSLRLTFPSPPSAEALLQVSFADGRAEERPIGLDGVLRLSPGGRFGLPVGLRGSFGEGGAFAFEYDEIANVNCFRFRLTLKDGALTARVSERTGNFEAELRGR
jgi:CubicO group peptidase (beta-lactamase class C family)